MKSVSIEDLRNNPVTPLIDVRLTDDFEACRLPNAVSNCVFEVAFTERLGDLAPEKESPCTVYGANRKSREARMAAEKMERLGYTKVSILEGGLEGWRDAGNFIEGSGVLPPEPEMPSGILAVDLEKSHIQWTGRNLLNSHNGAIGIKFGDLVVEDEKLVGGQFVLDMHDITCTDLDGEMRDVLIAHLKSDDFFDSERFPEAEFDIKSSEYQKDAPRGNQNLIVQAEMKMKGIVAPVELGAAVGVTPEGTFAAQASFLIDRTVWNVIYGSGKFFSRLGGHLVNDLIDIEVKVVTRQKPELEAE